MHLGANWLNSREHFCYTLHEGLAKIPSIIILQHTTSQYQGECLHSICTTTHPIQTKSLVLSKQELTTTWTFFYKCISHSVLCSICSGTDKVGREHYTIAIQLQPFNNCFHAARQLIDSIIQDFSGYCITLPCTSLHYRQQRSHTSPGSICINPPVQRRVR